MQNQFQPPVIHAQVSPPPNSKNARTLLIWIILVSALVALWVSMLYNEYGVGLVRKVFSKSKPKNKLETPEILEKKEVVVMLDDPEEYLLEPPITPEKMERFTGLKVLKSDDDNDNFEFAAT